MCLLRISSSRGRWRFLGHAEIPSVCCFCVASPNDSTPGPCVHNSINAGKLMQAVGRRASRTPRMPQCRELIYMPPFIMAVNYVASWVILEPLGPAFSASRVLRSLFVQLAKVANRR